MAQEGFPEKGPARTGTVGRHATSDPAAEGSRPNVLAAISRRLVRGELRAMDEFYDLTCDCSYGLARALLGSSEEAEKLLYGAYLDAWRTIRNAPPSPGTEMRWVLSLVLSCYRQRCTAPNRARPAIPGSGE